MNKVYARKVKFLFLTLVLTLATPLALANEGGEKFQEGVNYIPIKPPIVVNYGGAGSGGKVKYMKAEISLRTEDAHSATEASHHMPLIRDTLLMLLSSMTDEQMSTAEGKEELRTTALDKINEAIEAQSDIGHEPEHSHKSAKDDKAGDDHGKAESRTKKRATVKVNSPVSDLLFDNLVMQK